MAERSGDTAFGPRGKLSKFGNCSPARKRRRVRLAGTVHDLAGSLADPCVAKCPSVMESATVCRPNFARPASGSEGDAAFPENQWTSPLKFLILRNSSRPGPTSAHIEILTPAQSMEERRAAFLATRRSRAANPNQRPSARTQTECCKVPYRGRESAPPPAHLPSMISAPFSSVPVGVKRAFAKTTPSMPT